jgi:hypothetical protein
MRAMAALTRRRLLWRRRVEAGLHLVAPVLDLVLAAGDRVSRVAGRGEPEPEPPRRMPGAPERPPLTGGPDAR